jgi:hypothetical protein
MYLLEYCFTGSFSISARQIPGPVHHYVQLGSTRGDTLALSIREAECISSGNTATRRAPKVTVGDRMARGSG